MRAIVLSEMLRLRLFWLVAAYASGFVLVNLRLACFRPLFEARSGIQPYYKRKESTAVKSLPGVPCAANWLSESSSPPPELAISRRRESVSIRRQNATRRASTCHRHLQRTRIFPACSRGLAAEAFAVACVDAPVPPPASQILFTGHGNAQLRPSGVNSHGRAAVITPAPWLWRTTTPLASPAVQRAVIAR